MRTRRPDWPGVVSVGDDGPVRRILATAALALALLVAAPHAWAQTDGDATTTSVPEGGDIIPRPNTGSAPEDAGDRGGALQTVLFVGIVAGVVVMAGVLVRQSRRARADRGF